jgi:cell fate regulator YaaT (PSP1 superfamily)
MNPYVVGIRFQLVGKVYHFDASKFRDLRLGDFAVVETSRGKQLGEVVQILDISSLPREGRWKPIKRQATPRDLVLRQIWQKKELEAMINCRQKVSDMGIEGVKIVGAEFSFDGKKLSILYSSEAEGKVNLNNLRTAMQRIYQRCKVDLRQVGPRDVAKIIGGMGACGMDKRCCSMFLTEFSPISIKMAKEQGVSLTPSEITGMCGRLRCCLVYEYEQYVKARKQLPKRKKRVETPLGKGIVLDIYPLKESVKVALESGVHQEFHKDEVEPWEELEALKKKAKEPCAKHGDGECDCGKEKTRPRKKKKKGRRSR